MTVMVLVLAVILILILLLPWYTPSLIPPRSSPLFQLQKQRSPSTQDSLTPLYEEEEEETILSSTNESVGGVQCSSLFVATTTSILSTTATVCCTDNTPPPSPPSPSCHRRVGYAFCIAGVMSTSTDSIIAINFNFHHAFERREIIIDFFRIFFVYLFVCLILLQDCGCMHRYILYRPRYSRTGSIYWNSHHCHSYSTPTTPTETNSI
mmetsp:Transcript_42703/g.47730  ORF Transcript_42703/g.47730 Transcript_42703/m.47730 type:complete len:208 (-) Transcript_42703:804-1427(-)